MFDSTAYYRKWQREKRTDPEYRQQLNEYQKKLRRSNPERTMLNRSKSRAKDFGREFNLTIEDIVIPDICPILKIPLFSGEGRVIPNSPVLDRVNNDLGYIKGNVRVISHRANLF